MQPFAWALCAGVKDVENRSYAPPASLGALPCWLAIHASKSALDEARHGRRDAIAARCARAGAPLPRDRELARGALVGVVRVVGAAPAGDARVRDSPWAIAGSQCWIVDPRRSRALAAPVPARGRLGLWEPDARARAALDALVAAPAARGARDEAPSADGAVCVID